MLLELKVQNFAIIDSIHIEFKDGLNILSGETGAGKSVLLKSLALLMGEKAFTDTVRNGAEQAVIEGFFDLSDRPDISSSLIDMGIELEEGLVVRRVISAQGKSRVYLNGSLSALSSLKQIVAPLLEVTGQNAPLIEMTGQHENKNLQSKAYHLDLLDHYAKAWDLRKNVEKNVSQLNDIEKQIEKIEEDSRTREQRLDFLVFQRDEIKSLDLNPGDEVELEDNVSRLKNSTKLSGFTNQVESWLYNDDDSVLVKLHNLLQQSVELSNLDSSLAKKLEPLQQAKALIEEAVYEVRDYSRELTADPKSLDESQEKLSLLKKLQKKYGGELKDIIDTLYNIETEIEQLENSDENLKDLKQEHSELLLATKSLAESLHKKRLTGAKSLSDGVNNELIDLNMKGVIFSVSLEKRAEVSSTGLSEVEFMIQASKADKAYPIAKVASGGELSRILLSLKTIVGVNDQPRTYLFDEVDTGVSGPTAEKVGRKLRNIAKGQQVICVTHLPQVASFADAHFLIGKSPSKKGVHMEVHELKTNEQIDEIARLISGEKITKTSLDHAKQLLLESR